MNVSKKIILIFSSYLLTDISFAQTSLNLYPLNGAIGIKFFPDKKISIEPRIDFQFDFANAESNVFMNTEMVTTVNFLKEERFNMYSGVGLGANIYNQAQSNFSGSIPLGATYYLNDNKRIAIIGECGIKVNALDFIKLKSYALVGMQIRLNKTKAIQK
ncbi:MAG: hypothetical protein H0U95_08050 [Bacteroidetes bacterium]|nr:hypothetical protein [Bacteroidota bacterium]